MAKKKETNEKEAVKEAVDKVGVRGDWPDRPTTIQSTYAEGDIPLGTAVYTADEVDALTELTEIGEFSEWIVRANGEVTTEAKVRFTTDPMGETLYQFYPPSSPSTSLAEFYCPADTQTSIVAQGRDFAPGVEFSATRTKLSSSYQLGLQSTKPLQPAGDYALKSEIPDIPIKAVKKNGAALTPDSNGAVNVKGVYYATCNTVQSTKAKVATLKNTNETFVLAEGAVVCVKFTYANYVYGPTLSINGSVAKPIAQGDSTVNPATLGAWKAGDVVCFVYDGSAWYMQRPPVASTANPGVVQLTESLTANASSAASGYVVTSKGVVNAFANVIASSWVQNASTSYSVGDYVTYTDGKLYKAKVNIAANTAWNANNWEAVKVMAEIPDAVSVMNPTAATSSDEGKAADAYHTKQALDGKADLVNGLVPSNQLPSYVDDVLEYDGTNHFPTTGETGKIYVDTGTNKTYRWSGTQYVEISASDVSLTSEGGYPYQLTVGSTSCNINSVSLDSTAKTISVNGGESVYFGDSVSVSGGGSGPYQLYVNNNYQCSIPVASVSTTNNSVTVDGNTLYVPSISISGRTITLDGMGYNMYPISWNSTTRMLDLYGDSTSTLYVSDLEWDAAYNRLKHHDGESTYLIGWEEVSGTLSRTYDRLTIGNKTIYLDGNNLHIGKDSIAIAPSGDIIASDIWYDTNRTSTVYSKLQHLFGSDWGALRVDSSGNLLNYDGSSINKGNLKLGGTSIVTTDELPVVNDAPLSFYINGIKQGNEFSANSDTSTSFDVESYAYATCDTTSYTTESDYRIYTFSLNPYVNGPYMDVSTGSMLLVTFDGELSSTVNSGRIKFSVQTDSGSSNKSPMVPNAGCGTAWNVVRDQQVMLIYNGSSWVMVNSLPGIDSEPTNGSSNLVTSNGIYQFVGRWALSNGAGISITNTLISVNGTNGHGTTFNNPGGGSPLYIDVDDGSTSQAGIVQLDDTPKNDSTVAATPTSVNTVAKDIAPNWAKAKAYAQGAYVTKDGVLYRAKVNIAANNNWNASSWQATSIGEDVATDKSNLKTILAGMPANLDTYDNALQAINVLWNAVYKLAYGKDRGSGGNAASGAGIQ